MKSESKLMLLFKAVGLKSVAWSLRRLHCPVGKDALVLEVGSGGNPYFRSNVLLDAYEETRERHWSPLIKDRPLVFGFVENLPFKDKAFDFVIASHVLEHSKDPVKFIENLVRVSKSGYIEVPDAFMEIINPYKDHRLEITLRGNKLFIYIKSSSTPNPRLTEVYEDRIKKIITKETMKCHPFEFHVRLYWNNNIEYEILNPEQDIKWKPIDATANRYTVKKSLLDFVKVNSLKFISRLFSQRKRNSRIDLFDLLACPSCLDENLVRDSVSDVIKCKNCDKVFPINRGIPNMCIE
jgi:uncharacterized protein YbaR (Trm112 family)